MRESIVCHVVIVQQISLQGRHELIGTALGQTNAVVDAGIVYQCVDSAESVHRLRHRGLTVFRNRQLGRQEMRRDTLVAELSLKALSGRNVAVYKYRDRTFFLELARDAGANPTRAPGDDYDFVAQLQVHERQAPGPKRTVLETEPARDATRDPVS